MPLATGVRDAAQLQRRLWSPRILSPTMWFDAGRGCLPGSTWLNRGSAGDAAFSGTAGVYDATGAANTTTGKPSVSWDVFLGTGVGTITAGLATSTIVLILTNASNVFKLTVGAASSGAAFGAFPSIGIHLWNWPNGTLTNNLTRVSWLNGTLLGINNTGATGATGGAGCVIFCGSSNAVGNNAAGRILDVSGGNTYLANAVGLNRQGLYSWNEFITVNRQLTTLEQAQVEGYLAWKWGYVSRLPASHIYRTRPPEIGA